MNIPSVLVRHVTDRVALNRAQIIDHDLDALVLDGVAAQVRRNGELIARAASRASALAGADAKLRLREGGREA